MWKILFIVALCGGAAALGRQNLDQEWEMWKTKFNKYYPNKTEELKRRQIWEKNLQLINLHNLEYYMGMHTYTQGLNQFSDLNPEEMSGCLGRKRRSV